LSAFRREKYSKAKAREKETLKLKARSKVKELKAIMKKVLTQKERTRKPNQTMMERTGKQWSWS